MMLIKLKYLIFTALSLAFSQTVLAQRNIASDATPPSSTPDLHQRIARIDQPKIYDDRAGFKLWTNAYAQANSVPTQFSNLFVFPGFIDNQVKNNAYDKLKTVNRFGAELDYGIDLILTPDSSWKANGQHFLVSYRSQALLGSQFGKDIFHLVFGGNAAFAGQSADLSKTQLYAINYDVFELGYQVFREKSMMTVRLGAVKGNALTNIDIQRGSLFTAIDGSSLDLDFNGSYINSNRFSNRFKESPSMGMSLSAEFVQSCGDKWIFKESFQALGFINWNNSTTTLNRDTSFNFAGIDVGSVLSANESNQLVGDSLKQRFLGDEVQQNYMEALPLKIQLEATRLFKNNWLGSLGLNYRKLVGYKPLIAGTVGKTFESGRSIRFSMMYGGFGTFQTGIRVVALTNHHHSLSIGTTFNEGFISPKSMSGAGIQISYVHHL